MENLFAGKTNWKSEKDLSAEIKKHINEKNTSQLDDLVLEADESLQINEKLLNLIQEFDLSDVGIDKSFANSLETFIKEKKKKLKEKNQEMKIYNMQGGQINELVEGSLELTGSTKIMSNLGIVNRFGNENMFAEQLVIAEVHNQIFQSSEMVRNGINEAYVEMDIYRINDKFEVTKGKEKMLSNTGIFNVHQDSQEVQDRNDILYR